MSWDQRIPNEGLFTRQMSSYFPSGNNYVMRPINTHTENTVKNTPHVSAKMPIRDITVESNLYALNYYNPNDCMTAEDYKAYIKGQISSNLRFDESQSLNQKLRPLNIRDIKWNNNTSPR